MLGVVKQLTLAEQIELLVLCREVVRQAPLFQKVMPTGAKFHYLCTSAGDYGWISDRKGYRYETQHPITHQNFPPMPAMIHDLAVQVAEDCGFSLKPQSVLLNWYDLKSTLGLHQDKTEKSLAPVISISLGCECVFIAGGLAKSDPKTNLTLKSGDVLIMGGEHRLVWHGVKKIIPQTAPPELGLQNEGRVNLTIRQVYD